MNDIKEELTRTLAHHAEMVPVEDNLEAILTGTSPARLSSIAERRGHRTWPLAAAAASLVLAGTAGLFWVSQTDTESPAARGAAQPVEGPTPVPAIESAIEDERDDPGSLDYLNNNRPSDAELSEVRSCVEEETGTTMAPPAAAGEPSPTMSDVQSAALMPCVWSLGLKDKFVAPSDQAAVEASFGVREHSRIEQSCMTNRGWDVQVDAAGGSWAIDPPADSNEQSSVEKLENDLASCGIDQSGDSDFKP